MDKIALIAERDALRAQLDEAREALAPFAAIATLIPDNVRENEYWTDEFTAGELRRAAALLREK